MRCPNAVEIRRQPDETFDDLATPDDSPRRNHVA
jgi:hypothetical protein